MANTPLPALALAADLAERLNIAEPTGDTKVQWDDALLDASSAVRDAIGQPITPGTSTLKVAINEYGFGLIPLSPVVAVTAVVDRNGVTLPADGTGYEVTDQRLTIFPRWATLNPWASTDPIYLVTVSHGWDPIPGEILRWVYVLAAAQIAAATHGHLGIAGGVTSVAIDDGKVTYADVAGMIPDRVQERLRSTYGGEQQ
jgi:hypothetical protein